MNCFLLKRPSFILSTTQLSRLSSRVIPPLNEQRVTEAAMVGLPNAGKSSLLNSLLAKKMAAVSKKRNTTRENLLAVASDSTSGVQVAFYDTPGFVGHRVNSQSSEKGRVDRSVMTSAQGAINNRNVLTLVVIDAAKKYTEVYEGQLKELFQTLVKEVHSREEPVCGEMKSSDMGRHLASCFTLVLNKVDLVHPKSDLLPLTVDLVALFNEVVWSSVGAAKKKKRRKPPTLDMDVFMVSATASDAMTSGLTELRQYLHDASSQVPWEVDEDVSKLLTSSSGVYNEVNCELDDQAFAAECIREKIFTYVHKEVPYRVSQVNRTWRMESGVLHIYTDLVVSTKSHKKLVIGPKGDLLQRITEDAQRDLTDRFGMPVELKLWVREKGGQNN
mmetsp:Transcript_5839/g.7577  ORF Transcript_5839/g.7577 Transcript_5839/m.7577 type:complete len:388 (-) Transcript_5839:213-1376(-)